MHSKIKKCIYIRLYFVTKYIRNCIDIIAEIVANALKIFFLNKKNSSYLKGSVICFS